MLSLWRKRNEKEEIEVNSLDKQPISHVKIKDDARKGEKIQVIRWDERRGILKVVKLPVWVLQQYKF